MPDKLPKMRKNEFKLSWKLVRCTDLLETLIIIHFWVKGCYETVKVLGVTVIIINFYEYNPLTPNRARLS